MTNHSYFNFNGCCDCLSHDLQIEADFFTLNDENSLPTGEILSVENTPLDFREMKKIGEEIEDSASFMKNPKGYDHNFVINQKNEIKKVAEVRVKDVSMSVFTDCPCMQFYTGNFITEHQGKNGAIYGNRSGFCFETGVYPNNMNVPTFSTEVVEDDKIWQYKTVFTFIIE